MDEPARDQRPRANQRVDMRLGALRCVLLKAFGRGGVPAWAMITGRASPGPADGGDGPLTPPRHICGVTDVGRVRKLNEDAYRISADGRFFVVADGMGGHAAGEVASELAVSILDDFVQGALRREGDPPDAEVASLLLRAVDAAHEHVRREAAAREGCMGMGTTIVMGLVLGDRLHTCHVGDARCYVKGAAGLTVLTRDHSMVGQLVQAGTLDPGDVRAHPRRNELLQALGLPMQLEPDVNACDLAARDRVLLCSDGLWESLEDDEIRRIIAGERSVVGCARGLVDRAARVGGRDNITAVVYEHVPSTIPARSDDASADTSTGVHAGPNERGVAKGANGENERVGR